MAATQDGGAPRDPARVAQFGRRAGAPPPRVPHPPGPAPPPGARRAAESGLGAAFVSHRAGRGRRAGAPCRVSSSRGAAAPRTGAAVAARATCRPGEASPCRGSAASASAGTALPRRDRVGSRPRGRERRSGQARPPQAVHALGARVRAVVGVSLRSRHCCRRDGVENSRPSSPGSSWGGRCARLGAGTGPVRGRRGFMGWESRPLAARKPTVEMRSGVRPGSPGSPRRFAGSVRHSLLVAS